MGAVMSVNGNSLLGALAFLIAGLGELAVVRSLVYPQLRWRFERAKATQTQGMDPSRLMLLVRLQSLIVMPVLGFVLGPRLFNVFG
jgi:hypothetical protein